MSRNPKEKEFLNRYTSLPFLLDTLCNKRLTMVDPARWEDENDSYFMKLYKTKSKQKSVLALCFAENKSSTNEKYHNWKIYAGNSSGICIQFFKTKLITCIERFTEITYNSVTYWTIKRFENDWQNIPWDQLPFVKRKAFDGETEFRIIYRNDSEEIMTKDISIDLSCISKIILNPWIPKPVYNSVCKALKAIQGCDNLVVTQTTLLSYERWKKAGEKICED